MKALKSIILCLVVFLLCFFGIWKYAHAVVYKNEMRYLLEISNFEKFQQERINTMSPEKLIAYVTAQYNADRYLIDKIIRCESGYKALEHDRGLGFGMTGYHKKTFEYHKEIFDRPDLRYESQFDQIAMMSIAFNAGEKHRNLWTTYVSYKNGGEYTFYSRTLDGVYTVRCK